MLRKTEMHKLKLLLLPLLLLLLVLPSMQKQLSLYQEERSWRLLKLSLHWVMPLLKNHPRRKQPQYLNKLLRRLKMSHRRTQHMDILRNSSYFYHSILQYLLTPSITHSSPIWIKWLSSTLTILIMQWTQLIYSFGFTKWLSSMKIKQELREWPWILKEHTKQNLRMVLAK